MRNNQSRKLFLKSVFILVSLFFLLTSCKKSDEPQPVNNNSTPGSTSPRPLPSRYIGAENEEDANLAEKTALSFLLTFKEKNWDKQYEILHPDVQNEISLEEYEKQQNDLFPEDEEKNFNLVLIESVEFLSEWQHPDLDKTYEYVAKIKPVFKLQDGSKSYQHYSYLYFVQNQPDSWQYLWSN